MPRFYVPDIAYKVGEEVVLPPEAIHHAMRVLRMREDDEAELLAATEVSKRHDPLCQRLRVRKDFRNCIHPRKLSKNRPSSVLSLLMKKWTGLLKKPASSGNRTYRLSSRSF